MSTGVAGTRPLLLATIRYDGRAFVPWIVGATALSASSVLVYPWIFPSQAERVALAAAIGANPALGLIFGPAFDLSTTDGFNAWRSLALGGLLVGLGVIFAVTRSTRGQEDSGQAELLASGVLGRASRLLAGLSLALLGSLLLGLMAGFVTILCGGGWEESLLLGATFTATGWMFTAVAAVTAQLGAELRTANSLAVGFLGTLFLLRGFQYSIEAPPWTLWINPLAWLTETRPASGNHWWPLLLPLGFTLVLLTVAFTLQSRRDFGQGAIASRPGPARGAVLTPWRLALRLNRAPLMTWSVAFLALGVVFGYFAASISDILSSDSAVSQILAAGATTHDELISAFLVTILSLIGIIATIPGVQIMIKIRTEELEDRVEPVLASGVRRAQFYRAHVALAGLAPAIFMVAAGLIVAVLATTANIGVNFGEVILQAMVVIPAVWTVIAVAVTVIGARPQVSLAAWIGVLASFVLTLLGPTFKLWEWVLDISPFAHIPNMTATSPVYSGLLWITLATLVFLLIGFAGFRHRDIASQ